MTDPITRKLADALRQADHLLNKMGDKLNEMDACEPDDEEDATPIFEAVTAALAEYDAMGTPAQAQPNPAGMVAGWTDDQMVRFGNYITSPSLVVDSYAERLELFRKHETERGNAAPSLAGLSAPAAQPAAATITDERIATLWREHCAREWFDTAAMVRAFAHDVLASAQPAAAAPASLRERIAEAHDASLDDDHRACRAILKTLLGEIGAQPAAALPGADWAADMRARLDETLAAPHSAAVQRDAARLQWLLEHMLTGSIGFGDWWISADESADEWREAIDKAMASDLPAQGSES